MKYATYDPLITDRPNITGFYDPAVHKNIPATAIKITDAQWLDCIDNSGLRRIDVSTGAVVQYTPPGPSLYDLQSAAISRIEAAAEAARLPYIGESSGKQQEYKLISEEAAICIGTIAAGNTPAEADYPMLAASTGVDGASLEDVAKLIQAKTKLAVSAGAQIRKLRRQAAISVMAVADTDAAGATINTIVAAIAWP